MTIAEKIEELLEPSLLHEGYILVRVQVSGTVRKVLQLMIERVDEKDVTLDDCVNVSRYASALLDVEDPLPVAYALEVSSPGIDRPLVKPKDYVRFSGSMIKINLLESVHNRKRFVAKLVHADTHHITLEVEERCEGDDKNLSFQVPYALINNAKIYVPTDNYFESKGKKRGKSTH